MKNVHIVSTLNPSKLIKNNLGYGIVSDIFKQSDLDLIQAQFQNIYITDNSEIKDGNWCFGMDGIFQYKGKVNLPDVELPKKIILTDDIDLIKDGVQSIDDEFLEWFVKNPSCERVEVNYGLLKPFQSNYVGYLIHLPDNDVLEEPKQEAIEEAAQKANGYNLYARGTKGQAFNEGFIAGAKSNAAKDYWYSQFQEQEKNNYSEEEVFNLLNNFNRHTLKLRSLKLGNSFNVKDWFSQFKKQKNEQ